MQDEFNIISKPLKELSPSTFNFFSNFGFGTVVETIENKAAEVIKEETETPASNSGNNDKKK